MVEDDQRGAGRSEESDQESWEQEIMLNSLKKIGRWWRDCLKRLAQVNEEQFGGQPPSCCGGKSFPGLDDRRQRPGKERR